MKTLLQLLLSVALCLSCFGAGRENIVRYTLSGVNAKTTGVTTIFTTENGTQRFYPLYATVECTAASSVTIVAALSIGTNSTSFNNIVAISTMTGVNGANIVIKLDIGTVALTSIAANTDVKVNITTGATATSETIRITMFGYYQ